MVKGRHGIKDKPVSHCQYFEQFLEHSSTPFEGWRGKYSFPVQDMDSVTTSLNKYKRYPPSYDKTIWTSAWGLTRDLVSEQLRGVNLRKYTLVEAQTIMDGEKAVGWPLCNWYQTKQQAWSSTKFTECYNLYNEALYSGTPVKNLDTVFLKDEMRPLEKCVAGNARTVFCQDVVSATWAVQHGKMFDQAIIANSGDAITGDGVIAVGMTPFSNTFQLLTGKFKDCVCFELDGKSWDTNMFPAVHMENAKTRISAYGYDDNTARALCLYYEQVSSTWAVLPNGTIMSRVSGNPSGQANTTMDNSMWTVAAANYGLIRTLVKYGIIVTRTWFKKEC